METNTSYVKNEPTVGMNFFENIPPGLELKEMKKEQTYRQYTSERTTSDKSTEDLRHDTGTDA